MTKVILVRHGQTVWNLEMKYQGHSDIALTDKGLKQAALAAGHLATEKVAAVYASDLDRAFTTAKIIAAKHKLPVIPLPALREICFGEWEGLTYDGINSRWEHLITKLFSHPDEIRIPGGETFRELKERAAGAIEQLVAEHPNETIVVVSHGGTIRTILCAALNIHLNYIWSIKQDNTAINIIEYYKERTIVGLMNDTCHLNGQ